MTPPTEWALLMPVRCEEAFRFFSRAENRVALASNSMKARVDVNVEFARDFGSLAEGGQPRDASDARVGVSFSVPLQQRVARGKIQQEQAAIEAGIAGSKRIVLEASGHRTHRTWAMWSASSTPTTRT